MNAHLQIQIVCLTHIIRIKSEQIKNKLQGPMILEHLKVNKVVYDTKLWKTMIDILVLILFAIVAITIV